MSNSAFDFSTMPRKTFLAFLFFAAAKILGVVGVAMGFAGGNIRTIGGVFLITAALLLIISVSFSFTQMKQDKKFYQEEEEQQSQINQLKNRKNKLEEKVRELEARKDLARFISA